MIELKHISKTFTSANCDVEALKDINLKIKGGEIFGIIGLSGAGKSTLVRCINLLERPTSGEVWLNECNLTALAKSDLLKARKRIGMIFQGFNLLEQRNVLSNVCFPLELNGGKGSEDRARELLNTVGLIGKERAYPSQLSGGQKQRVAIARALATSPDVLLCDEATSALDPETTQQILSLLKKINAELGVTIVVITHEMRVIEEICDRVAVIDNGLLVEEGAVKGIFVSPVSAAAKRLILPTSAPQKTEYKNNSKIRLVFDGTNPFEPIIADMVLKCQAEVNILFADTKTVEGKTYGHMILCLPDDDKSRQKIFAYLTSRKVTFSEVA